MEKEEKHLSGAGLGDVWAKVKALAISGIGMTGVQIQYTKNGQTVDGPTIPSASSQASGVVTTSNQTFAGVKTFVDNMYTKNIYPNSTNTYELGDDQHQFATLRVNNIVTNAGNGLRFGANNGDFKFYGTKTPSSMATSNLVATIGHEGGMTLHKGNLAVSAGNITASGNIIASGNVTAYGNVVADGGVAAGGIADLTIY